MEAAQNESEGYKRSLAFVRMIPKIVKNLYYTNLKLSPLYWKGAQTLAKTMKSTNFRSFMIQSRSANNVKHYLKKGYQKVVNPESVSKRIPKKRWHGFLSLYTLSYLYIFYDISTTSLKAKLLDNQSGKNAALDRTLFHCFATFMIPNIFLHYTLKSSQKVLAKFTKRQYVLVYVPMMISLGLLTLIVQPVDKFVDKQLLNVARPFYNYKSTKKDQNNNQQT